MLEDLVIRLSDWGGIDVLAPFLLLFAIFFAILEKSKAISEKKNVNTIIAIVITLITVTPHITGVGPDIVDNINSMLPIFSLIAVALIMMILVAAAMGLDNYVKLISYILIVIVVLWIIIPDALIVVFFLNIFGVELPTWLEFLQQEWFIMSMIILGFFALVVYYISRN